jgi:hypothetical protein
LVFEAISGSFAGNIDEILGETVGALVPFRPLKKREFPGPDQLNIPHLLQVGNASASQIALCH